MKDPYRKYLKVVLNLLTAAAILLFIIFVVPKVLRFFMPFVVAWIVALIANPLVKLLDQHLKIRRKAGSAIVIIAVLAAIIGIGYAACYKLVQEGMGFMKELPAMWTALEQDILIGSKKMDSLFGYLPSGIKDFVNNLGKELGGYVGELVNSLSSPTVNAVGNFAKVLPGVFIGVIMCLLSAYFFIAQREEVITFGKKVIPRSIQSKWDLVYTSLKNALGGYFKAQFKIEVWIYILLVFGFAILDVKYALFIAIGIAILDFLPVFGTGTVLIPWTVIKFLGGDYKMAIGLLLIWIIGQVVRQLIQPKIVGDSVGMPAIPTLILLYAGYKISGVFGMILAVPAGIILVNMNEAGIFKTTEDSIKILIKGFNNFRKLTPEDKKEIE